MRILLVGLAVIAVAGCGGSSTSSGSGGSGGATGGSGGSGATGVTGGSGGSGATATGGSGGSGASGGSPADASADGGFSQCFDSSGKFVADSWKTCTGAGQCSMVAHQTDCCGNSLLIGVESSHLAELQACEQAWRATLPQCGCPAGPPKIEQPSGTTVSDQSAAQVTCGDFTQTSGICFTEPK